MATWLGYLEPAMKAAGKTFDRDMEAASLALALDSAGFVFCRMPGGIHTGHCPTCGCEPVVDGECAPGKEPT